MLSNWQRIEEIIKWTGYASVSAFAREIGLNRSENLYQIKRGNNGISRVLSNVITERYPEISRAWLLTGEGQMLKDAPAPAGVAIPFYNVDAVKAALLSNEEPKPKPDYYISFPPFDGCRFAAVSMSDAMLPDVARGTILFFAPVEVKAMIPGEMYLVLGDKFNGLRFLRRNPNSDELRLLPANRKGYDEVVLQDSDIKELYAVRGIVTGKGI